MMLIANLPDDVLRAVVKDWLGEKEIVRLDSACCQRAFRDRYLNIMRAVVSKVGSDIFVSADQYVHWFATKNVSIYQLTMKGTLSDNFITNLQQSELGLIKLSQLTVSSNPKVATWLQFFITDCRNMTSVDGVNLTSYDVWWIEPVLQNNLERLIDLKLCFNANMERTQPISRQIEKCTKLQTIYLYNNSKCLCYEKLIRNCTTSLISVSLQSCSGMTETAFAYILSLPLVEDIDLYHNSTVRGSGNFEITTTRLIMFALSSFSQLNEENMLLILDAFPNKSELNLHLHNMQWVPTAFEQKCKDRSFHVKKFLCYD